MFTSTGVSFPRIVTAFTDISALLHAERKRDFVCITDIALYPDILFVFKELRVCRFIVQPDINLGFDHACHHLNSDFDFQKWSGEGITHGRGSQFLNPGVSDSTRRVGRNKSRCASIGDSVSAGALSVFSQAAAPF